MPKAQKKIRTITARATPLANRDPNALKPSRSSKETGNPKKGVEKEADNVKSPQLANATVIGQEATSAGSESANNYLILATLSGTANPTITRLLSLPPSLTFDKLHAVLRISFGWGGGHMHDFNVSLVDEEPGFLGPPPCLFIYPDLSIMPDEFQENSKAETEVTLADVYEKPEWKDRAQIEYEYDHGDGWSHDLALLGRATPGTNAQFGAPDDVKIICLDGQGHPAVDNVGGICGWESLKDAFKHPRKAGNREQIEWYKNFCFNGEKKLDPYAFDIPDVNDGLRDAFADI